MRTLHRRSTRAALAVLAYLSLLPIQAADLPTIEPTSPLQGGACFAFRCFPTSFALDANTAAYANTDPAVSVFTRSGTGTWQLQQILTNPDFRLPTTPAAIQRALPFPPFGNSIALSGNSMLVAGTSSRHSFKDVVYVLRRTGTTWEHVQVLAPTRSPTASNTVVTSIAMHGDVALVSGVETNTSTPRAQVDVFIRRADGTYLRRAIITPPSVATEGDGYKLSLYANFALIGDPNAAQGNGRAYLYERTAGGWIRRRSFAPAPGIVGARLGSAVVVNGNRIAISAPEQPIAPNVFGAMHMYVRDDTAWRWDQALTLPEFERSLDITNPLPTEGWRIGRLLTLDGDRLVTSPDQVNWSLPPLAYLFERATSGWSPVAKFSDESSTLFARGILLAGSTLLLASADTAYNTPVYIFELPAIASEP